MMWVFLFTSSFLIYVFSFAPSIFWRDSPEFQDIIQTLGISHPAGSPLFVMLGKIFALFPFGNLYMRANIEAAFFASMSVVLTYVIFHTRLKLNRISSSLLAFFLALSFPVWYNATSAEVYTTNLFFLTLLIFILLTFLENKDSRFLLLGAFIYGLSSGIHAAVALYLLAFIWIYLTKGGKEKYRLSPAIVALFLLGFSVYMFLPLRAIHWPQFDWGNPQTLKGFIAQLTDAKDQGKRIGVLTSTHSEVTEYWSFFIKNLNMDLSPIIIFGAIGGIFILFIQDWIYAIFYLLLIIPNVFFFISWKTGTPLLPTYFVLILLTGYFVKFLLEKNFSNNHLLTNLILASGLVYVALLSFPRTNKYNYWAARTFFLPDYIFAPKNSVFIAHSSWFIMRDLQDIERNRDDVKIITPGMVFEETAFSPIDPNRFPEIESFENEGDNWRRFKKIIKENSKRFPVLIQADDSALPDILFCCGTKPEEKFTIRTTFSYSSPITEFQHYTKRLLAYLEIDVLNGLSRFPDESSVVGSALDGIGIFLSHSGFTNFMVKILRLMQKWYPNEFDRANIYINLGIGYFFLGKYTMAEQYLKKAIPQPNAYFDLGVLYYTKKEYKKAYKYFNKLTLITKPDSSNGYYFLFVGKTLYHLGKWKKSVQYLNLAKKFFLDASIPKEADKFIRCIKMNKKVCK